MSFVFYQAAPLPHIIIFYTCIDMYNPETSEIMTIYKLKSSPIQNQLWIRNSIAAS